MQELAGHPGIPNTEAGLRRVLQAEAAAACCPLTARFPRHTPAVLAGCNCPGDHVPGTACDVRRTAAFPHGWCVTHARAVVNTDPGHM